MNTISSRGKIFVDELGRERIFNGMNMVDKEPYSFGKDSVAYSDDLSWLDEFYRLGFNIIRLGTTWSVMEPSPGHYNDDAIASMRRVLDRCAELGIYVFIDMHQDLYSGDINNVGDGAPKWAVLTDGIRPIKPIAVWAEPYFWGRACHRAFDNFWSNRKLDGKGLLDYYADMWAHVADSLGDHPALFGFDLLNEPFPDKVGGKVFRNIIKNVLKVTFTDDRIKKGKIVKNLVVDRDIVKVINQYDGDVLKTIATPMHSLLVKFDTERYTPFLNRVTAAIRKKTSSGVVFVDNCYYSNLGIPCSNAPISVGGIREPNQCFSPHGYDFMVDTPLYKNALNSRIQAIFDEHKRTQERLGSPVVVGEWGGSSGGTEWFPHIRYILNMFDSNKWSNTYWTYHDGLFRTPLMEEVLCRPYPRAVTGKINSYSFDWDNREFTLSYTQDRQFDAPTEIFVPGKIQNVECDGEYTCESVGDDHGVIKIVTAPGEHTVKVSLN